MLRDKSSTKDPNETESVTTLLRASHRPTGQGVHSRCDSRCYDSGSAGRVISDRTVDEGKDLLCDGDPSLPVPVDRGRLFPHRASDTTKIILPRSQIRYSNDAFAALPYFNLEGDFSRGLFAQPIVLGVLPRPQLPVGRVGRRLEVTSGEVADWRCSLVRDVRVPLVTDLELRARG